MPPDAGREGRRIVRGACPHDCPDTCATLVTVENGRAIAIRGADDHPPTQGVLCTKVSRYLDRTYSRERVLHPMRRVGRKGAGRFERMSWDDAIGEIATRFRALAGSPEGPETILPYSYAGNMGLLQYRSMDRRFFHRLGASLLDRTICASAGKAGWTAVIGASIGMDLEACVDSKLIVIWGSNAITSNLHFWTRAQEAKRQGARLVAIDPFRTATADKCHEHIAPMPGTDAALAYGLMHVLIRDGLCDRDYLQRYTVGFDALAERAREWTPGAHVEDLQRAGRADRAPGARPRHDQAGGDPPQLRHAAPRGRRQRDPRRRVPARARGRLARPRRRRAALLVGRVPGRRPRARAPRPDPGAAANDQHVDDRRRADRIDAAGARDHGLQQQPGRGRARIGEGGRGVRARGPLRRRARPVPDRHGRLRGHPAAGDLVARAPRHPQLVRPPARQREQRGDRPAGRGAAEHRGVPPARRGNGLRRAVLPRHRRRHRARRVQGVGPAHGRLRLGRGQARGLSSPRGARALRAVRPRRLPDAVGQVRILQRERGGGRA
jgi:hypothetical protein